MIAPRDQRRPAIVALFLWLQIIGTPPRDWPASAVDRQIGRALGLPGARACASSSADGVPLDLAGIKPPRC
jgi:hypothetical protein